ncbi:MAG TPA: hypothetical protein VNV43_01200, partial [Candidatus Acidoferrales bacterium]|nr:hypothetical protein [Candidatus Acidoferrales bacterium]
MSRKIEDRPVFTGCQLGLFWNLATTAVATAITTATATATAAITTATSSTARTFFTGTGNIDGDGAA